MWESVLVFRNFLYLKISVVMVAAGIGIYVWHEPLGQPNGGSWVGYTLGTVGALLIVWLAWYGVRKRRYGIGKVTTQEWLSAHVYLGLSLIIIATLHTGFQVGWNVHTLAYVLMLLVIVSGIYGIYLYVRLPEGMSWNRSGLPLDEIMASIADLDNNCQDLAIKLGDEINELVREAAASTGVGGGPWRQLSGLDPKCPTAKALKGVHMLTKDLSAKDTTIARQLILLLTRKNEMLRVAREDVRYRAWLNVWLVFHVPLTVGLLAALGTHILSVFFYW